MKIDRMGVLVLMAHLIITLAILALYGYSLHNGKPVTSIENILLVIMGYWFGSMGSNALRPNGTTQVNKANEVNVTEQVTEKVVEK